MRNCIQRFVRVCMLLDCFQLVRSRVVAVSIVEAFAPLLSICICHVL